METDVGRGRPRTQPLTGTPRSQPRRRRPVVAALRELVLVAILYLAYSASRVLADDDLTAAVGRARWIHAIESRLGLAWEHTADRFFAAHDALGLLASYWYCTAHYVVTAAALLWLYSRGAGVYRPARRALGVTTLVGLLCYLALPTAPPRLVGGYVDVLGLHAGAGWWGTDASAPRGLGQLTNQLAAFPSLHAGWSLWVALAVTLATGSRVLRAVAWSQAAVTAIVVVGTANHWTLDVLVGWGVTGAVWALCVPVAGRVTRVPVPAVAVPAEPHPAPARAQAARRPAVCGATVCGSPRVGSGQRGAQGPSLSGLRTTQIRRMPCSVTWKA